jgi:hypothetical protein
VNINKITLFGLILILLALIFPVISTGSLALLDLLGTDSLHTEGKYIKNATGEVFVPKGVNYADFIDSPDGHWHLSTGEQLWSTWNPTAAQQNLDVMQDWGVNTVRTLATVEWWDSNTNDFRGHIKDWITWSGERDIYVVFGFWRVSGSGVRVSQPYPPYTTLAEDNAIIATPEDFVNVWQSVASELKNYPNVLFNLWNEPTGDAVWFSTAQQCIDAIRATGAENLIVIEGDTGVLPDAWNNPSRWSLKWIEDYPLTGSNLVYSPHMYWSPDDWGLNWPDMSYDSLVEGYGTDCLFDYTLNNLSKPLYVGEIGANLWYSGDNLVKELEWFSNSLKFLDSRGIGYTAWTWRQPGQMYFLFDYGANFPPSDMGEIVKADMLQLPETTPTPIVQPTPTITTPTPLPSTSPSPSLINSTDQTSAAFNFITQIPSEYGMQIWQLGLGTIGIGMICFGEKNKRKK